jgi:tripartite-type tricarboxylate transporter receptor subunit TctC
LIARKMNRHGASPTPRSKAKLERAGYPVAGASPDKLEALLKSEIEKWSVIVQSVGI